MIALNHKRILKELWRSDKGVSKLTLIVFGTIFGVLFYTGYSILPFFYDYFEFSNQMAAIIPVSESLKDSEIRSRLGHVMKELEMPTDPKDLIIDREDHYMKLSLKYQEVFYVSFRGKDHDIYIFHFHAHAEGPF